MWPFRIGIGKKNKAKQLEAKKLAAAIHKELEPYMKREDLETYLADIEKDKNKKRLWDGLSTRKKIKVLRYALARRGKSG